MLCGWLQLHTEANPIAARATDDQIKSASSLVKRIDLKQFSVCQFANPGKFHPLKAFLTIARTLLFGQGFCLWIWIHKRLT